METRQDQRADSLRCTFSAAQWLGERRRQEDAWVAERIDFEASGAGGVLFAVADGMGGENRGDVASRVAIEAFANDFRNSAIRDIGERLRAALDAANCSIAAAVKREPLYGGMGTTLLGCCVAGDRIYWVSSGDSLLLLVRDGESRRLNADHSYGALKHDPEFARETDPGTPDSALFSCLTGNSVALVDLETQGCRLFPGDVIVAASDGLETLGEEDLTRWLQSSDQPAGGLIERVRALAMRGQDNVTAVVVRVNEPVPAFVRRAIPGTRAIATHAAALLVGGAVGFAMATWGGNRASSSSDSNPAAPQAESPAASTSRANAADPSVAVPASPHIGESGPPSPDESEPTEAGVPEQ